MGSTVKMVNQHLAGVHLAAACGAMALGIRAGADAQRQSGARAAGPVPGPGGPAAPRCGGAWRRGAITDRLDLLRQAGVHLVIADAVDNDDLRRLAASAAHLPLWVAGSGLGRRASQRALDLRHH